MNKALACQPKATSTYISCSGWTCSNVSNSCCGKVIGENTLSESALKLRFRVKLLVPRPTSYFRFCHLPTERVALKLGPLWSSQTGLAVGRRGAFFAPFGIRSRRCETYSATEGRRRAGVGRRCDSCARRKGTWSRETATGKSGDLHKP